MIDLKGKPFYLDEEGCLWVEKTLNSLTLDEKIGQLFCEILWDKPECEVEDLFENIEPAGVMYRPFTGKKMQDITKKLQERAKVPLLIACNLERGGSGGNGGLTDGTYVTSPMGIAATGDFSDAYHLGLVAANEGSAVGINWTFEPIIDIDINCENPITNVRTYGSNIDTIYGCAKGYIDACKEKRIATTLKHFPGDGVDYRDQHLMMSVNNLSVSEWYDTYGKLYNDLIDYGVQTVMAAHITQPNVIRDINPTIKDENILPASLSKELMCGVLREKFGFNGVIVTDATQMVGFTCSMPRKKAVPYSIARGADMFLFTINQKEDIQYMKDGIENRILSEERLNDAVTRILALKASLGLHKYNLIPEEEKLSVIKCKQHLQWAEEIADKNITLVKNKDNILPLNTRTVKNIKLIQITNEKIKNGDYLPELKLFKELLQKEGFHVSYFNDVKHPTNEFSLEEYKSETDLIIYFANMKVGSNQTTIRITWDDFLGEDSPKYVKDIPTLFLSFSNPYHLVDVPMVKTYINAYACNEYEVKHMVEKLMGRSEFKGISPVDPFCGLWDTKI